MSNLPPGTANNAPGQPLSASLRRIVIDAVLEAQRRNAALVEAEHLLLALTVAAESPARQALEQAGVDTATVESALITERARSLRAVGCDAEYADPAITAPRVARPRWGASAKDALTRTNRVAGAHRRQRSNDVDLLAALFSLELGTLPRALELAGIDRQAIVAAALRAR